MKPIIVEAKDGKVMISKDELEKIIEESYNSGFSDGQKSIVPITYPVYPNSPTYSPDFYKVTCATADNTKGEY